MTRTRAGRVAALAFLAAVALGTLACTSSVGVGVGPSVYGGWGGYGGTNYGGGYAGGPMYP